MSPLATLAAMYLFMVPFARFAFRKGRRMLSQEVSPETTVRSLQLARKITDPDEKRAVWRQTGWMWIWAGMFALLGPILAVLEWR